MIGILKIDHIGIRIFDKNRSIAFYEFLVPLRKSLDLMEAATQDLLYHGGAGGELQVGVLPTLASHWLIQRLPEFTQMHPSVQLKITTLDVNFASDDRSPDLERKAIDVGLFYGDGHWDSIKSDLLLPELLVPVVSPDLVDANQPADYQLFEHLPLLQHSTRPNSWAEWLQHNNLPVQKPQGISFEHFYMAINAAIAGLGIAMVPRMFVQKELNQGLLLELEGNPVKSRRAYYLVYSPASLDDPKVQKFRSWVLDAAGQPGNTNWDGDDEEADEGEVA